MLHLHSQALGLCHARRTLSRLKGFFLTVRNFRFRFRFRALRVLPPGQVALKVIADLSGRCNRNGSLLMSLPKVEGPCDRHENCTQQTAGKVKL